MAGVGNTTHWDVATTPDSLFHENNSRYVLFILAEIVTGALSRLPCAF
jgi:hypothetical protein